MHPEVKQAVANQDLAKLSTLLYSFEGEVQWHAAVGMGQLTENLTEAREILSRFLARRRETDFGERATLRLNANHAAEQSLAALLARAETSERTEEVSRDVKTTSSVSKPLETKSSTLDEQPISSSLWFVVTLVTAAALGLLWLLLKKRKV